MKTQVAGPQHGKCCLCPKLNVPSIQGHRLKSKMMLRHSFSKTCVCNAAWFATLHPSYSKTVSISSWKRHFIPMQCKKIPHEALKSRTEMGNDLPVCLSLLILPLCKTRKRARGVRKLWQNFLPSFFCFSLPEKISAEPLPIKNDASSFSDWVQLCMKWF